MLLRWILPLAFALTSLSSPARAKTTSKEFAELDRVAAKFVQKSKNHSNAPNCLPLQVDDQEKIIVLYNYCSESAFSRDGRGTTISDNFSVPDGIARRFHFWRRIYSIWSKEQYILHAANYPEVIIAAFDGTHLARHLTPHAREQEVKKTADRQEKHFRDLLMAMHRMRDDETKFTPAMQRLADQMRHITEVNKYKIASETMRLQRGQREFIEKGLGVAPKYMPAIEKEFIAQGIPVEIAQLTFVESSFNLQAVSKVGASGVFQIMPATGRQYLKISGGIDERNDPIKAAAAACKLLRLNYRLTGSWPLAITAYNHGVGGIRRAVNTTGSNDLVTLINEYDGPGFGFASKNFYASFLGSLATLKERERLFPGVRQPAALVYDSIRLQRPTSISSLRKTYRLSLSQFVDLNPDIGRSLIRTQGMLPSGYVVKIPGDRSKKQKPSAVNLVLAPARGTANR